MVPMPLRPLSLLLCVALGAACRRELGSSTEPYVPTSLPSVVLTGVTGKYLVEMPIVDFDPAWGEDLTGYKYTVLLTIHRDSLAVGAQMGTFTELRLLRPDGTPESWRRHGSVQGISYVNNSRRRFGFELAADDAQFHLTLVIDSITDVGIKGGFGCCGHISGTFAATRVRP